MTLFVKIKVFEWKLPFVDRIQPQSNTFATGVENKATGDLRLKDSPDYDRSALVLC